MATLPPALFATGSAKITMARQIGAALGVAMLVAVLGTPSPADVVEAFAAGGLRRVGARCAVRARRPGVGDGAPVGPLATRRRDRPPPPRPRRAHRSAR